ncbi:MAG: ribosome silencing factor [Candidatus Marinimicrobia bacterium]|nr:ribosome silencing factor [Candidatus Neomarinimicrobiota bacterium]MCF7851459.1 ribosome silencing factor [Candidatus Neomarinimicrobiota bacterium]MCF7904100.1 ribosome silencing factor [Candidatus Neomarinimicrobiota bacterium]
MPDNYADSKELALQIGELALQKKADSVKILDVHDLTSMTDFFVICSGNSDVQVKAIVDHIVDEIAAVERPFNREGYDTREWILLDYINVVVHVFHEASRDFYDLERLWGDAEISELSDDMPTPDPNTPLFDDL